MEVNGHQRSCLPGLSDLNRFDFARRRFRSGGSHSPFSLLTTNAAFEIMHTPRVASKSRRWFALMLTMWIASVGATGADTAPVGTSAVTNTAQTLPRIRDANRSLTDRDVAEIERVALTNASKPWLLIAIWDTVVAAYCEPATTTRAVRRGPLLFISKDRDVPTVEQIWRLRTKTSYAQLSLPGSSVDRSEFDSDILSPFELSGRFTEDELVSLCGFIRSNPRRDLATGDLTEKWPIQAVLRTADDAVNVIKSGSPNGSSGQTLQVRQQGGQWVIVRDSSFNQ